jgi:hypothetical protein
MHEHDPGSFAAGLAGRLAPRSRHICVFLGAGASRACGLPTVAELQKEVLKGLEKDAQAQFEGQLKGRNLEQALTRLRRIHALLDDGTGEIDGLTAHVAANLDRDVCRQVVAALDLKDADLDPMLLFAAWVGRTDHHLPLEIFTVNYDLLIETALEDARIPYFDGFVGSLRGRFHTDLVEEWPGTVLTRLPADFVRLWKLHGSVNWAWSEDLGTEIVRLGESVHEGTPAAIYPSDTKYEESRRVPFIVLQDRFRRALNASETLAIISGYSFSDQHLNELIFDAASHHQRSEFVSFCHSAIPDALADRALRTPNLQAVTRNEAIIGGVRANWREPAEPPPGTWDSGLLLDDFRDLAGYLARSSIGSGDPMASERMEDLLARIRPDGDVASGSQSSPVVGDEGAASASG